MSHAIHLEHLQLALASAKLRQHTRGRTCLLAAVSAAPLLHTDCSNSRRLRMREDAMHHSQAKPMATPMQRGHLAELIQRTRLHHGLPEVRKTWGTGLRALLAEPRHVLNGGAA